MVNTPIFALDLGGEISDSSVFRQDFAFLLLMKTLHLYIFREIFKTFFFALIVFTGVLVLVVVAEKAVMEGIPLTMALSLLPYTIPEQLKITIPVALLLATTTFFDKLRGQHRRAASDP